jgi:hypothetical protein
MQDTLLLRPSLHYACRHFISSHLNFTQLHFTTLSFDLTSFIYCSISPHITTLHLTALLDDFRLASIPFTSYEHFFLTMTDAITSENIDLSSWITLYCERRCGRHVQGTVCVPPHTSADFSYRCPHVAKLTIHTATRWSRVFVCTCAVMTGQHFLRFLTIFFFWGGGASGDLLI